MSRDPFTVFATAVVRHPVVCVALIIGDLVICNFFVRRSRHVSLVYGKLRGLSPMAQQTSVLIFSIYLRLKVNDSLKCGLGELVLVQLVEELAILVHIIDRRINAKLFNLLGCSQIVRDI